MGKINYDDLIISLAEVFISFPLVARVGDGPARTPQLGEVGTLPEEYLPAIGHRNARRVQVDRSPPADQIPTERDANLRVINGHRVLRFEAQRPANRGRDDDVQFAGRIPATRYRLHRQPRIDDAAGEQRRDGQKDSAHGVIAVEKAFVVVVDAHPDYVGGEAFGSKIAALKMELDRPIPSRVEVFCHIGTLLCQLAVADHAVRVGGALSTHQAATILGGQVPSRNDLDVELSCDDVVEPA
mmetsp:Transcript_56767/g.112722  ORF Transcript_56767/g.112722 Transcript_56767/m.112722 type:complete len:241 (-) Transcript_56767:134-856(-)